MKPKNLIKPFIKLTMYVLRVFPIEENKIVFSAYSGRVYGDNPKYIAEYIIDNNIPFKCVFVLRDPKECKVKKGISTVKLNTLRYLYELATARVWIDNTRKQPYIVKRKGQYYFQTWHGSIGIKRAERDAEDHLDKEYIKTAINDSKNIDTLLTTNKWGEEYFGKYFWYSGPILKCGSPRLDVLFKNNNEKVITVKEKVGVGTNEHVVLYAPTFRRDADLSVYNLDYGRLIQALELKFGGTWKAIVKLHPNINTLSLSLPENVIDATKYPDISELYLITDFLITDYSSTMFDYSVRCKPVLLFATDINEYINDRDFFLDIRRLPYKVAENNEELIERIHDFNMEEYKLNVNSFQNDMGLVEDGKGSETIVNYIINELGKQNERV